MRVQTQLAVAGTSRIRKQVKVEGVAEQLSEADKPTEKTTEAADVWKLLLEKIGIVMKIGDQVAEVSLDLIFSCFECSSN
jgi:hypothetical protein